MLPKRDLLVKPVTWSAATKTDGSIPLRGGDRVGIPKDDGRGSATGSQNSKASDDASSSTSSSAEPTSASSDAADSAEQIAEENAESSGSKAKPTDDSGKAAGAAKREDGRGSRWWYLLLLILVVEFWVYGRQGEIEVCVGKQGTHDFALLGQERTDKNRWRFPRCETRENLGLRSNYELLVEDAAKAACRGQTLLRHRGEGPACLEQKEAWQHQVETSFIPPWDSRYYEHLLWFLF